MTAPSTDLNSPGALFARACRSFGQGVASLHWTDSSGRARTAVSSSFTSLSLDPPLLLLNLDPADQAEIGPADFEVRLNAAQARDRPDPDTDLAVFDCVVASSRRVGERVLVQAEIRGARLLNPDSVPQVRIGGGPGRIEESP